MASSENPAALSKYDPGWPAVGNRLLAAIKTAMSDLPATRSAQFDHIGSTSVPGLAAKPIIDLQVSILPLPPDDVLAERLGPLGLRRASGSRPDSPGVYFDLPRGSEDVRAEVWAKSLFVNADASVIVHIRRSDSPWAKYTVWFRDWLRAHPEQRDQYEAIKRELSAREVGKRDYDEYTLAKTAFFDDVQAEFERWAQRPEP